MEQAAGQFVAASRELTGALSCGGPIERVFELFSPLGERAWVPGWDPELLHPPDVAWAQGQIFRTREEWGEAIWVVTRLDREAWQVEYHRVEPQRYVARVRVGCTRLAPGRTAVDVAYAFVGLSPAGNEEIRAMTDEAYAGKMQRWQRWIDAYLAEHPGNAR